MIKLFEEYNEYYSIINCNEFNQSDFITFSDDEFKILKDTYGEVVCLITGKLLKIFLNDNKFLLINKLPDEWYICRNYLGHFIYKYYKCDQFEGLIKLLEDIL